MSTVNLCAQRRPCCRVGTEGQVSAVRHVTFNNSNDTPTASTLPCACPPATRERGRCTSRSRGLSGPPIERVPHRPTTSSGFTLRVLARTG